MKLIKSIVRPNKVDEVKDALTKIGISGMTVAEVRGHGKQKGHTAIYRGKEYNVSLLPKMQVEVVVGDSTVDEAIKAIIQSARTGEIGDGRVFVLPVHHREPSARLVPSSRCAHIGTGCSSGLAVVLPSPLLTEARIAGDGIGNVIDPVGLCVLNVSA